MNSHPNQREQLQVPGAPQGHAEASFEREGLVEREPRDEPPEPGEERVPEPHAGLSPAEK
jgi:hypothetical protein